ncbi:DUF4861 family protein [Olivibacter sitiensis]|uniref:DUF4861 family protein n=1 Tax=Olivibacter sitiensis TaxID=376470 RepID=UPI000487F262|nr:DUF4861 family protein [Olivibacter sitiensis]
MEKIFRGIMLCLLCTGLLSCADRKSSYIVVSNALGVDRKELVSIDYVSFKDAFGSDTVFRLMEQGSGKELPYQLERLGGKEVKNVLVWVELAANDSIRIEVEKAAAAPVEARTYARYVPERKDDFAWENDKVAFRMYGKALEDFPAENAHGTDVWAKRTSKLVVDEWYKTGDYHQDHGEGLDYYSVGLTLGAGDIAPFVNGKISYPKHYNRYELLDNGPLRSTFKLFYEPWNVGDKEVVVEKTISIDAGSQLNKVEAVFRFDGQDVLPVVAGIVLRGDKGQVIKDQTKGIAAYWEPQHDDDGILGIAVLSAVPATKIFEEEEQLLSLYTARNGEPITYYNGAAWNKAGKIKTEEEWTEYLEDYLLRLNQPLIVTVK